MNEESRTMTAKKYLRQVQLMDAKIASLQNDRKNLIEVLYSLGGKMDGEKVQTSRSIDRFGNVYAKIDEKERMIAEKVCELIDFKLKISEEISTLSNALYISILHKHYILFESFEQIAVEIGYSYRYVTKMHGYALLEFYKKVLKSVQSSYQGA